MSTRPISAWIVPLVGHQFDLEDLLLFLEGSVAQVAKREDAYYLVLPTALAGSAPEPIRALAAQHLALINGASSLLSESFRPIALGEALYGIDSEGHVANTVIQIGSAEHRMKGGHVTISVNGIARPDARVGAALPSC